MENPNINLLNPNHAYFLGFVQGDGHLYRQRDNPNKGKLTVELNLRDQDIVFRFKAMFPESTITYRRRATNFAEDHQSIVWTMCCQAFRENLERLGVPVGKKSLIVRPPDTPYSVADYWRGMIDADGSLGLTSTDLPFLSLVTVSEEIARAWETFLQTVTGKLKITSRNARDNAFNIMVTNEDAVAVAAILYYPDCLALQRKAAKAAQVSAWIRPAALKRKAPDRDWTEDEDALVAMLPASVAEVELGRSRSSVSCRRVRLRKQAKDNDQSAEGAA